MAVTMQPDTLVSEEILLCERPLYPSIGSQLMDSSVKLRLSVKGEDFSRVVDLLPTLVEHKKLIPGASVKTLQLYIENPFPRRLLRGPSHYINVTPQCAPLYSLTVENLKFLTHVMIIKKRVTNLRVYYCNVSSKNTNGILLSCPHNMQQQYMGLIASEKKSKFYELSLINQHRLKKLDGRWLAKLILEANSPVDAPCVNCMFCCFFFLPQG